MKLKDTISARNAAECRWDVIVIGAGPSGALLAHLVARVGKKVLLVDKNAFPRDKICGCCLNGTSLGVLDHCGLGSLADRLGALKNNALHITARGRVIRASLGSSVSISRHSLDAALVESAIKSGCHFLGNTMVRNCRLSPTGDHVHVGVQLGNAELIASVAVVATGLGSQLWTDKLQRSLVSSTSWLGAGILLTDSKQLVPAGVISMTCAQGGYVGVVRVEGDQVAVAAALDPQVVESTRGIGNAVASIFTEAKQDTFSFDWNGFDWRGTPLLTRRAGAVAQRRVFAIGDATGYVEPFTGEGMGWAMRSAVAVFPLVLAATEQWRDELSGQWTLQHRRLIVKRQRFCRFVAGWLRRPWAVSSAAEIFSAAPFLLRPILVRVQATRA